MQNARAGMETLPSARAFWIVEPGRGELRKEPVRRPGPEELLVRTEFTAISRGTESLVFSGRVPPSEYGRMRAPFQAGEFPAPVKYGYCNVGVVEGGEPGWHGVRIFALYPHQTSYVIPVSAANAVPREVPAGRAVLAANMETALNGCWDADPKETDRVTVIGAGTVGCLVAWVIRNTVECSVELVDVNPHRAAVAEKIGVTFVPIDAAATERTIVVHTSGSEAGLRSALDLAAPDGTIVEMSWFGDRLVTLPLGGAFHSRRLTIKSSQVGALPPARREHWDFRRRMALALDLLKEASLDALISGESRFEELPAVMAQLTQAPGNTLTHRIRYD
jgi:threonine dehydrogenase-like Zn-dependent dehydrogenase